MRSKVLVGGAMALVAAGAWAAWTSGAWELLGDEARIAALVAEAGWLGPLVIALLMTGAVVFSPIPSAPIALAAGAAYGHLWGTVYVLIGAELGAIIAFGLAWVLGYEALHRRFGDRLEFGLMGSQPALMATVFVTRPIPFLSFDLVSYAAVSRRSRCGASLWRRSPASFRRASFWHTSERRWPREKPTASCGRRSLSAS